MEHSEHALAIDITIPDHLELVTMPKSIAGSPLSGKGDQPLASDQPASTTLWRVTEEFPQQLMKMGARGWTGSCPDPFAQSWRMLCPTQVRTPFPHPETPESEWWPG